MRVAIMGAGLSGLACGITLEQNGIKPYIFEKRSQVDDRFVNGEIFLNALTKPTGDCLSYLSEEFSIYLQPVGHIKSLTVYSENEKAVIKGNLGFNVVRGRRKDSIAQNMKKQLKSDIIYNSNYGYEDLLTEYTHVILATGDGSYSEKLENYRTDFTVSLKGAIVNGNFDRYTAVAWLDNRFAPKGYAYFIPLSEKEANIVIAYPDHPENTLVDINQLWDSFYSKAQESLNQTLEATDTF